jgi:hypothetical protein
MERSKRSSQEDFLSGFFNDMEDMSFGIELACFKSWTLRGDICIGRELAIFRYDDSILLNTSFSMGSAQVVRLLLPRLSDECFLCGFNTGIVE